MKFSKASRLRELAAENAKLKHLLAEEHLDRQTPKSALRANKIAPQDKRVAIRLLLKEHQLSERQACRLVGLSRDSHRHVPVPSFQTEALTAKIVEIAQVRRRFGYRRVHGLLRPEVPGVNHKRVYRLYSAANLAVRKRQKVKAAGGRAHSLYGDTPGP